MGLFNFWKKPKKEISIPEQKVSKTAVINTIYGSAHWPDRDYENFSKESYMKNVISFRCIFYISSCLASVKWKLYKKDETGQKTEITDSQNPYRKIIQGSANPDDSFVFFIQKVISYFLISGNSYI